MKIPFSLNNYLLVEGIEAWKKIWASSSLVSSCKVWFSALDLPHNYLLSFSFHFYHSLWNCRQAFHTDSWHHDAEYCSTYTIRIKCLAVLNFQTLFVSSCERKGGCSRTWILKNMSQLLGSEPPKPNRRCWRETWGLNPVTWLPAVDWSAQSQTHHWDEVPN